MSVLPLLCVCLGTASHYWFFGFFIVERMDAFGEVKRSLKTRGNGRCNKSSSSLLCVALESRVRRGTSERWGVRTERKGWGQKNSRTHVGGSAQEEGGAGDKTWEWGVGEHMEGRTVQHEAGLGTRHGDWRKARYNRRSRGTEYKTWRWKNSRAQWRRKGGNAVQEMGGRRKTVKSGIVEAVRLATRS